MHFYECLLVICFCFCFFHITKSCCQNSFEYTWYSVQVQLLFAVFVGFVVR